MLGQPVELAPELQALEEAGVVVLVLEGAIGADKAVQLTEVALLGVAGGRLVFHQDHVRRIAPGDGGGDLGEVLRRDVLRDDLDPGVRAPNCSEILSQTGFSSAEPKKVKRTVR